MTYWDVQVDLVVIAPPDPVALDITRNDEVCHYRLRSSLCYPDQLRYVAAPDAWILGNAHEDVPMVGQESPRRLSQARRTSLGPRVF